MSDSYYVFEELLCVFGIGSVIIVFVITIIFYKEKPFDSYDMHDVFEELFCEIGIGSVIIVFVITIFYEEHHPPPPPTNI